MKKIDYTPINLLKHQENGFEIIKKFCIDNKINGSRDLTLDNIINGFICDKTYCPEVIDTLVTTFLSTVSYMR